MQLSDMVLCVKPQLGGYEWGCCNTIIVLIYEYRNNYMW